MFLFVKGVSLMGFDYQAYEKECAAVREINALHLSGFEKWLENCGLSAKTVERHVSNVDFYINDYLCYYDASDVQHGCYSAGSFLGDWFIRKAPSSCTAIKSFATSFKKFYAYLLAVNVVEPRDYDALCRDIKDGLPDWLDAMRRYDDMLDGLCDDDQDDFF